MLNITLTNEFERKISYLYSWERTTSRQAVLILVSRKLH